MLDHSAKLHVRIEYEDRMNMSGVRFSGLLRGAGYGRRLYVEWGEWRERTTPIEDDAFRHGRICGNLLVTQKQQRKSEKKGKKKGTKTHPEKCVSKQPWDE